MRLYEEVEYALPDAPDYIRLKDSMVTKPVSGFSRKELEFIADRWKKQLLKNGGYE